ncbi:MAG: J domain-containing protein [Clostridiales bacterium]|jgi:hypothetical protein|nr:J domain-containing protein [Clostridiales bacterium]
MLTESIVKAFNTLGLEPNATEAQVNNAYKEIAKKYHPDLHMNNTQDEIVHLNELLAQTNNARKILLDYFAMESEKNQVTPQQEAEAITLMYTSALKNEIEKTSSLVAQTNNAIIKIINNFGENAINNTAPLFDDVKKLVKEQKKNLNVYAAIVPPLSPIMIKRQTNNIKMLADYIVLYDNLSKFVQGAPSDIFASISDIAPSTEPTIESLSNALYNELESLYKSVLRCGPDSIKDNNVENFLLTYSLFSNSLTSDTLKFDSRKYNFLKLMDITNKTLPFSRNLSTRIDGHFSENAIEYLLESINVNVLDSLIKNHDAKSDIEYLHEQYQAEFEKFLNCVAKQDEKNGNNILEYSKSRIWQYTHDAPFMFKLGKTYNKYYFLKDYNFDRNENNQETLWSIRKHCWDTIERYIDSIFDNNADEKSPIEDVDKFYKSIYKFIEDFRLFYYMSKSTFNSVGESLDEAAKNMPAINFIKNNFPKYYIPKTFRQYCCSNVYGICYSLRDWLRRLIEHASKHIDDIDTPLTPEYMREVIDSVRDFICKVENFKINDEIGDYDIDPLDETKKYLGVADEIEKMMKLPHYNEVYKQIYEGVSICGIPDNHFLIMDVTKNINKFCQKLLSKALFDNKKTLTENEAKFLEFSQEYIAKTNNDIRDYHYKENYESVNYILETLSSLKTSGININNAKEVEKFFTNRFNKATYKKPEQLINSTYATYGKNASKKISGMLTKPTIKLSMAR